MKTLAWILAVASITIQMRGSEASPYLFYNFEDSTDFPAGALVEEKRGIQVMKPQAVVVATSGAAPSRHLMVSGAAVLLGNRFTGDGRTHLEVWVQPQAVALAEGAEFLDYDGAAVALFSVGEGQAELHALHIAADDRGFWVSTGKRIPVTTSGAAETWHRINITQHWEQGRWDLALDGIPVLQGLGRGSSAEGRDFELWLYGHGDGAFNAFDDVLVCAEPPDILESHLSKKRGARVLGPQQPSSTDKRVRRQTTGSSRRQHDLASPDPKKAGRAQVLNIHLQIVGGGRLVGEFESKDKSGRMAQIALYSPGYDADGKPKPLEVQIQCDAELEEGASLGQIEWAITEHPKEGEDKVRVIVFGTFAQGPSLIAKVPSEWSNKPLSIQCGQLGLQKP